MLTVSVLGGGTVTSDPVGISCAGTNNGMCSARFLSGASVTLSPNTAPGWAFSIAGWGGDCAGSGGSATLMMTQNRNCSVAFAPELTVSIAGSGTITSSPVGISCTGGNSGVCSTYLLFGTPVTLTAIPPSGWVFSRWTGDCTGTGDCMVLMSNVRRVGGTVLRATGPAPLVLGPKPLLIAGVGRERTCGLAARGRGGPGRASGHHRHHAVQLRGRQQPYGDTHRGYERLGRVARLYHRRYGVGPVPDDFPVVRDRQQRSVSDRQCVESGQWIADRFDGRSQRLRREGRACEDHVCRKPLSSHGRALVDTNRDHGGWHFCGSASQHRSSLVSARNLDRCNGGWATRLGLAAG